MTANFQNFKASASEVLEPSHRHVFQPVLGRDEAQDASHSADRGAQVSALVQEPRVLELDLSDKPALRDLLRRLERHTARNVDDPARYPTPPAEGNQADPSEKNADSRRTRRRPGAADDSSSAWRCAAQHPCGQLPNDDLGAIPLPPPLPTQSAFAPDTAGATILKHFESRHPHPHPSSSRAQTDVGVEQLAGEHRDRAHASGPGDVEISIKTEA